MVRIEIVRSSLLQELQSFPIVLSFMLFSSFLLCTLESIPWLSLLKGELSCFTLESIPWLSLLKRELSCFTLESITWL